MKKPNRIFLPPIWMTLVITVLGIYGMNLVYKAVTDGAWGAGLVGAVLLAATVGLLGTPLAYSRIVRKELRARR